MEKDTKFPVITLGISPYGFAEEPSDIKYIPVYDRLLSDTELQEILDAL